MSTEQTPAVIEASLPTGEEEQQSTDQRHTHTLRWKWQDAFYLLLLLVLIVVIALSYTPNLMGEVAGQWWDPLLNIWTLTWDTTTLLHAPLQLWQAPILYPNAITLSYSENLLGEALFFAPFYLITHNPVFSYNMVFYLTFLLCGTNMYVLARHYTGKPFASFIAALIYAFAPYRIGQIDHIHIIAGEWIPLAFLYLDRSLQEGRWRHWSLFALFYLLQLLSSIYYGIFLTYTLLAYLLFRYAKLVLKEWPQTGRAYLVRIAAYAVKPAIVFGAVLVILALLMAPYLLSLVSGLSRGIDQTESYSAFIRDFLFTAPYNWLYGVTSYNGVPVPADSEHHLFLGWVIMLFALLGGILVIRQKARELRVYLWTGIVILLFSFGPALQYSTDSGAPFITGAPMPPLINPFPPALPLPWFLAYFILPGFKGLRVPARLIGVLLLVLALLAAYAVAWLQEIADIRRGGGGWEEGRGPLRSPWGRGKAGKKPLPHIGRPQGSPPLHSATPAPTGTNGISAILKNLHLIGGLAGGRGPSQSPVAKHLSYISTTLEDGRPQGSPPPSRPSPVPTLFVRAVLLVLPFILLLEAYVTPTALPVTQVPTGSQIPAVYQWLATHGGNAPIVELPMADTDMSFPFKAEAWYDYYSIYHPHPIADGWSGYRPQLTIDIADSVMFFPSHNSIDVLKRYHIRYVVLHPQLYVPTSRAPDIQALQASTELRLVAQFGQESIWEVQS